jgi:ribosome-binding factor A
MSRRTERIGKLLQQTIGQILLRDLSDPRIDVARTSITRVKVQEDLLRAKVYVSVMGSDAQQQLALNHAAGRVAGLCRQQIELRYMPALSFLADEQFKGALKTWDIIRQAMAEIRAKEAQQAPEDDQADTGEPRQNTQGL